MSKIQDAPALSVEWWFQFFWNDPHSFIKFYLQGWTQVYPNFGKACELIAVLGMTRQEETAWKKNGGSIDKKHKK